MVSGNEFTTPNSFTKGVYRDVYAAVDPRSAASSQAGKVVMVTGASRGIGKHGISDAFALAGAKAIIITARKIETLKETEANIKKANPSVEVLPVALEVTDESSVAAAFKTIAAKYDTIDVLVNNAGSFASADQPLNNADPLKWWSDFEVNVRGTMLVTKYFLSFIGTEKAAHLIYMSSGAGLATIPGNSSYSITKLADLQLASYAAAENSNVTAIAFHPGIVETDMVNDFFRPFAKDTPELAGAVIVWLSTEQAKFLGGRYTTANWDVNELVARKDEIVSQNLLTVGLNGVNGQVAELLG